MGQTIDSHMNYEGNSQTPLQRRIEQRVSNGLGYSDQHNCSRLFPSAFPARLEAEPVKVYSGDRTRYEDSNRAIQTSLMLLDIRAGIHHELEYTHLNQLPPPSSNFGYDSLSLKKNGGPLGRLGDRLRLAAATAGMSFAPLSERRGFYSGHTFTKDLTPRDEGSFFKKDLTPPDENSLPLCPKPEMEYIPPYDDLDSCATLRRFFDFEYDKLKQPNGEPVPEPQNCRTPDSGRIIYYGDVSDIIGRKVGFEEPKLSFEKPKVGFEESQTCNWRPVQDDDSNLPLPKPFVDLRDSMPRPEPFEIYDLKNLPHTTRYGSSESYPDTEKALRKFDEELDQVRRRLGSPSEEFIIIKDPTKGRK